MGVREWDEETFDRLAQYAKSFGVTKALHLLYGEPTNERMDKARERLMDDGEWIKQLREEEQRQQKLREKANEAWAKRFLDAWAIDRNRADVRLGSRKAAVYVTGMIAGAEIMLNPEWSGVIERAAIPHEWRNEMIYIAGNLPLDIVDNMESNDREEPKLKELTTEEMLRAGYPFDVAEKAAKELTAEKLPVGWYRFFLNPKLPLPGMADWQLRLTNAAKVTDLYVWEKADSIYDRCLVFDEEVACAYDGEKWDMGLYIKAAQMAIVGTHRIDLSRAPVSVPESR